LCNLSYKGVIQLSQPLQNVKTTLFGCCYDIKTTLESLVPALFVRGNCIATYLS